MGLRVGDPDGFGRYGTVDETVEGLRCHDCGHRFIHLGLQAYRGHGITADEYRGVHGLARTGLIVKATRIAIIDNARRTLPAKTGFLLARDSAAASRAHLHGPDAISPAGMHAIRATARARRGRSRKGTVVVCGWCGAEFCPMTGASRRRYCSRSCASRANRARTRS